MAIDTAEKRFSILGLSGSAQISYRMDLTSGVNAADRRHLLESYRGIAAASPAGTKNFYAGGFANAKRLTRGLGFLFLLWLFLRVM